MRRYNVTVVRSERESVQTQVGAWEIDVLRLVHGPQNVSVGEVAEGKGEYPDPHQEFERLCQRYGQDRENGGAPYAAQVYGALGVSRLAELIEQEQAIEAGQIEEPQPEVPVQPVKAAKKAPKKTAAAGTKQPEVSDIDE